MPDAVWHACLPKLNREIEVGISNRFTFFRSQRLPPLFLRPQLNQTTVFLLERCRWPMFYVSIFVAKVLYTLARVNSRSFLVLRLCQLVIER